MEKVCLSTNLKRNWVWGAISWLGCRFHSHHYRQPCPTTQTSQQTPCIHRRFSKILLTAALNKRNTLVNILSIIYVEKRHYIWKSAQWKKSAMPKKILLRLLSGIMYSNSSSCLKLLFVQHNVKHTKTYSSSFMYIFSQRAICETARELRFQNSSPDKTTMGFKSTN